MTLAPFPVPGVVFEALHLGSVKVIASRYVPLAYPTRWQIWRWKYWSPEEPKPEPVEQFLMVDDVIIVLPKTFEKIKAALEPRGMQ